MRSLALIGAVVFAVAFAAIGLLDSSSDLQPPYPKQDAVRAALRDERVRSVLKQAGWDQARVIALDRTHWRVTFFDGPRYVLDAAVDRNGRVDATEVHLPAFHPPGAHVLWNPALLLLFALVFVAAVSTRPLRSIRNLDATVIAGLFTLSAFLLDGRLVAAHVWVGAAGLLYVAVRCLTTAFAREPVVAPAFPPLGRFLPLVAAGALAAALILVITSTGTTDVAFAGLAGATLINHGISPYGHIPIEVVHGDTYPLLSYVLYIPFAAIAPVRDSFDSLDGALWLNALALVGTALVMWRWGLAAVLAWLAFPAVLLAASSGGNDVPAAFFAAAGLATLARTQLSVALFTLAGWVKIAPALALVPVLARLRGQSLLRAFAVIVALLAAGVVAMLAIGGTDAVDQAITALRFQFERGSWLSVWRQLGAPVLQAAFQAMTLALLVIVALAARRRPDLSPRQIAALVGGLLALVQLSANFWSFAYLAWLLPFVIVALFPSERRHSRRLAPRAP